MIDREAVRPAFEAWVRTQNWFVRDDYSLKRDQGDGYFWLQPQRAWEGFIGALEHVTSDAAVERAARAMCIGKDPDSLQPAPRGMLGMSPLWHRYEHLARAAVAAIAASVKE